MSKLLDPYFHISRSVDNMSSNLCNTKTQNRVIRNPANLRWQYTIESLIKKEQIAGNVNLINQLEECMESLAKFPLVLEEATHCAILCGFNANIIDLMKKKASSVTSDDDIEWKPLNNLENWNLSPISKRKTPGIYDITSWEQVG